MTAVPATAFRMSIRSVEPANREVMGRVLGRGVRTGETVVALPGGASATVVGILPAEGGSEDSEVRLRLDGPLGQPGEILSSAADRPEVADQFAAEIRWSGAAPLIPGRTYGFRIADQPATGAASALKYRSDPETGEHLAARHLGAGEAGLCNISLDRLLAFDPFEKNRETGSLTVVDADSGAMVGEGRILFALRRATNIHWQAMRIGKRERAAAAGQRACILWFTGLSGAGKSTVADLVEQRLHALGRRTMSLDGDNIRHGLNRDLGFTDDDRVENIRRVGEVAKLMVDAGLITLVSFISPFRSEREMARGLVEPDEFYEIFVDAPLAVCEARDPKGLYRKARAGALPNFTGISSPYEAPEQPDLLLRTGERQAAALADEVIAFLTDAHAI